ncbi:hypothetical protein DFR58_1459 [Anaerobacterium chartisolvens]|uniref:Polymerase/histidinol phosphatase N-terminal domain-containing protein n=1 Tax=Anaerobacterium chartisolvens TaxID=1297424 RepID=A0A369AIL2_9FIRM|nr:PHP domain-containing protein [Anaerobacterium chartisolvens]RCX08168.1 hypothetical protein DFR58_1459 [Anaerobacterium chartisolvens]
MKAYTDLHIHSALSPCAENDMTPNNIVSMAVIKGLDIIAITDHNSAENCTAAIKAAAGRILVVPGMELETKEEVHILCLFPSADSAMEMQKIVYSRLPPIKNRTDIFGQQLIMDENDSVLRHEERMLITAADLGIDEAFDIAERLGGALIPAHIDRSSYSILSNLGMIPEHLDFKYLEISANCSVNEFILKNTNMDRYTLIKSSDAHSLGNIMERESSVELEELSINCLIKSLRKK